MGLSFTSDIIDENWNSNVTYHDVLESAYVVPTMYAVLVLGGWGSYLDVLRTNSVTYGTILIPVLNVTQDNNVLAIKSKPCFHSPLPRHNLSYLYRSLDFRPFRSKGLRDRMGAALVWVTE